jgi:protein SCO1
MRSSLVITLCVAAGLFTGGALLFLFPQVFGLNPTPGPQVKTSGRALIGGPFSLVDHTGKRVSEKTYAGKFMLVFFGYTNCPNLCPAQLQVMSLALDALGEKAKRIQPIFVTLDPQRDTVAAMARYVGNYDSRLIGLTGTPDEIRAVSKSYRVFYSRETGKNQTKDYLIELSGIIYLMDERGEFVKHFSFGVKPDELAAEIKKFM